MSRMSTIAKWIIRFDATRCCQLMLMTFVFSISCTSIIAQDQIATDSTRKAPKGFVGSLFRYAEKTVFQYIDKTSSQKNNKPFIFSIIGAPFYTNETKVGLEMVGSGLFRLKGCENDSLPSDVSLFLNATTSGAYAVGITSDLYFPEMKSWFNISFSFNDTPLQYWGVGYEAGQKNEYTNYNMQQAQFVVSYFRRIDKDLSAGITFEANDMRGKYIDDISFLHGEKRKITAMGAGFNLVYDSRDVITDPYKGMYININNIFYPNYMGSIPNVNNLNFIFRYYKRVTKSTVLAFDLDSELNFGKVPWGLMALTGNSNEMRGYYSGRYRDKKLIDAQVELRQHIYKRSGVVVWAGAGNVFREFSKLKMKETLPTVGFGYRFRLKERINLRLDYGFGRQGQSAFYINLNEAF